jgi:hypothetical protein
MCRIFAVDMNVLPSLLFNLLVTMFGLALVISMIRKQKERAPEVPELPSDEPAPDLRLPDPTPGIQRERGLP